MELKECLAVICFCDISDSVYRNEYEVFIDVDSMLANNGYQLGQLLIKLIRTIVSIIILIVMELGLLTTDLEAN